MSDTWTQPPHHSAAPHSEYRIRLTLKAGMGDAHWITVGADTADELNATLSDMVANGAFERATDAEAHMRGGRPTPPAVGHAPAEPAAGPGGSWQSPPPVQQARTGRPTTTQACMHGVLQYDEWGHNPKKNGAPYQAFKCPLKVADYRDPQACNSIEWFNG